MALSADSLVLIEIGTMAPVTASPLATELKFGRRIGLEADMPRILDDMRVMPLSVVSRKPAHKRGFA